LDRSRHSIAIFAELLFDSEQLRSDLAAVMLLFLKVLDIPGSFPRTRQKSLGHHSGLFD